MNDEKLTREQSERLEEEIERNARERIKRAILELLKEHPKEIYAAALELIKQLRNETDRQIGLRIRGLFTSLFILAIVGLAALGYWWTKH